MASPTRRDRGRGEYWGPGPDDGERCGRLVRADFGPDDFDPLAYYADEPPQKRHQHQHANAAAKKAAGPTSTADVKDDDKKDVVVVDE